MEYDILWSVKKECSHRSIIWSLLQQERENILSFQEKLLPLRYN